MKRSADEDPLAFLARRKKTKPKPGSNSSSSSSSSSNRGGRRPSSVRRDSIASVSSSALFTERRRRRPSEADSMDSSSSSQAAAAAAAAAGGVRGTPSSSQTSFPSWSQGGGPGGSWGPPEPSRAPNEGQGATQGSPDLPPTPSPAFPFGSPLALPPIPSRDTSRCLLLAAHLPARARLSLAGVGGGLAADAELIAALEDLLDRSLAQSRNLSGVQAALYEACGERLRQMLLLLFEANPQQGARLGGPRIGLSSTRDPPLLAIPSAAIRGDAAAILAAAETSSARSAAAAAVAAAAAAAPTAADGRVMQLQQRDISEAALVSKEAARALLQEMQQQAEDILEIWPLRKSVVFLSQPQDAVSFCLDAFLLYRASSVHLIPCLLSESLPALDLLEAEGLSTAEGTAGEILWLPLWCAEVLSQQRLAKVMLPPFLQSDQVKGYLRAEERHKNGLDPLPVFFFEAAKLLLFNPLVQPLGTEVRWEKEKGLVLQLWDRRQAKIAAALTSANFGEKVVRMDHIQPSETYMLSHMRMEG